jgi:hypothetical protein
MAVDTVLTYIELSVLEPLGMRQLPIQDLLERATPGEEFPGLAPPEFFGSVDRLRIQPFI